MAHAARHRRLQRIFRPDNRTVIVAMDGAPTCGPVSGMAHPEHVLRDIVQGGADAVLMTYGLIQRYGEIVNSLGLILRCDGGVSQVDDTGAFRLLYSASDALHLGADAVACNVFPQSSGEQITMDYLSRLVSDSAPWNLPVLAEALPGGFLAGPAQRTAEAVAFASRTASELGVDFVKTDYTGSVESFASVVESSYVPVVILGGAADTPRAFLQKVSDAMAAGASGVAVGRNIWQHPHPARMTRALVALVHEGLRVDQALELLANEEALSMSS